MSAAIERIRANAERLAAARYEIKVIKEEMEKKLSALEAQRDELQNALLAELRKEGLSSIKTEDKETYSIGSRKGILVKSEARALKWAIENMAVSIDKRIVAQKLKDAGKVPSCFEIVETEFISIRSPKVATEETKENE